MPEIRAFRGWRYNPSRIEDISKVVAPPYDVISARQQQKLYDDNPYNVIRLVLGKDEKGDSSVKNKYVRAADFLKNWKNNSILVHEDKPSIYVYVQDYREGGKDCVRTGFLGAMKLDEKMVLKHENTLSAPKEDRLALLKRTRTNLSPIFGLFEDNPGTVQNQLKKTLKSQPIIDITVDGVRHRLYAETRKEVILAIQKAMKPKPMYIADGHHRFEVALAYKKLMGGDRKMMHDHGWEYVLTYFSDCLHNPFKIFPTHRLVRVSGSEGMEKLARRGTFEKAGNLDELLEWLEVNRQEFAGKAASGGSYDFGFYSKKEGYSIFRLNKSFASKAKENPVDRLDVSVLHRFVIEPCFGIKKIEKSGLIDFTRDAREAVTRVDQGHFSHAIFLRPTSLKEMILASKKGMKMPQKSTYFYPKLLSGLVFHSFEDGIIAL